MNEKNYSPERIVKFYNLHDHPVFTADDLLAAEADLSLPGRGRRKSWRAEDLPRIGARFGFLRKPRHPLVTSVFVTKGGVLKSSLTLNLARLAALHDIRTCVLGLDMQGDITTALGHDLLLEDDLSLDQALARLDTVRGLPDHFLDRVPIEDLLKPTDLPSLWFIPETPELVALEQGLNQRHRREYWLRDQVLPALKERFDWILLDCSPNWNQLITNALVASDVLISPLECKINNFRNFRMFETFIAEFRRDMGVAFDHIFVPTRFTPGRKLSRDILTWYQERLPRCTRVAIKDSVQGEEAVAMHLSVPEFALNTPAADEMKHLTHEIWRHHLNRLQPATDALRPRSAQPEMGV